MRVAPALAALVALAASAAGARVENKGKPAEESPIMDPSLTEEEFKAFNQQTFDPEHILTFFVAPGEKECFYESIEASEVVLRGAYFVRSARRRRRRLAVPHVTRGASDAAAPAASTTSRSRCATQSERRSLTSVGRPRGCSGQPRSSWGERAAPTTCRPPRTARRRVPGEYEICFDNHMSKDESKTVTFALHIGDRSPRAQHVAEGASACMPCLSSPHPSVQATSRS